MRSIKLAPWILIGSLTVTSAAQAGCCDDFWSCMATVATAGVSCQIQGMIDIVKTLSETVSTLFNDLKTRSNDIIKDAKTTVESSVDEMKQLRQQALADLSNSAGITQAAANPPVVVANPKAAMLQLSQPATMAQKSPATSAAKGTAVQLAPIGPAVVPADPTVMRNSLKEANAYVQELKSKANTLSEDLSGAEKRAREAVVRHVVVANRIALDVGLEPLRMLRDSLLDLLNHPERLFDPSAQIEADLRRISSEIPALLDRIGREVTDEAKSQLEQASTTARQLEDQAAVGRSVADAARKLAASKTQPDLDALNRLLPNKATQKVTLLRGVVLPVGIAAPHERLNAAVARVDAAKLPVIAKHRATISTIVTDWERLKRQTKASATVEPAVAAKANNQLSEQFRGKSKQDAEKKRRELLDEARRRFANDPKTLEKVQRYLESHAG